MKYLYSTGKKGFRKANCEYFTDGKEFDEYHRFTAKEIKEIDNLGAEETVKLYDEWFPQDEIRIKRVA
jgi:hypothetical protein